MSVYEFVKKDNKKGLFPLNTNVFFIENGENDIRDFVYNKAFNQNYSDISFLPFPPVFALKDSIHVRKLLQLDPLGTFFIYDFALRNSSYFQLSTNSLGLRNCFGYGFDGTKIINSYKQYHLFRERKYELKKSYRYYAKIDIANCFNSFYHHDIVSYISTNISQRESVLFGQFLREGNGGRSINCFPQGIYPAKLIGNFFLKFIENSRELRSAAIIRFLDDIFLFSNNATTLEQDIMRIQTLIGEYSLSLNADKTKIGSKSSDFEEKKLDKIKKTLLMKREKNKSYNEDDSEIEIILNPEEISYLKWILSQRNVTEEDVELALTLLKEDEDQAYQLTDLVLTKYPGLIKNLYHLIDEIEDTQEIRNLINKRLKNNYIQEYELFWIARIILDHYIFDETSAEIIHKIYNHPSSTTIVKSAILEVDKNVNGLFELKDMQLRNSPTGLQAACAVAGLNSLEKAKRNQIYKYAKKASPTMNLLCDIASKN